MGKYCLFSKNFDIELILNGIFTNKYNKIWCWQRNYKKLISVFHPFAIICWDFVTFLNIQLISTQIWLVQLVTNRYSPSLKYSVYSDSHLNFEFEGKIKFIAVTCQGLLVILCSVWLFESGPFFLVSFKWFVIVEWS